MTAKRVDGFESAMGMELLSIVGRLIQREHAESTLAGIRSALWNWQAGKMAAERKLRLFNDRFLRLALDRLEIDISTQESVQAPTPSRGFGTAKALIASRAAMVHASTLLTPSQELAAGA